VEDGADKLLLEVHNPTDKLRRVHVTAASGFTPLDGLDRTMEVPPCSSVKTDLAAKSGTLLNTPYEGD